MDSQDKAPDRPFPTETKFITKHLNLVESDGDLKLEYFKGKLELEEGERWREEAHCHWQRSLISFQIEVLQRGGRHINLREVLSELEELKGVFGGKTQMRFLRCSDFNIERT